MTDSPPDHPDDLPPRWRRVLDSARQGLRRVGPPLLKIASLGVGVLNLLLGHVIPWWSGRG